MRRQRRVSGRESTSGRWRTRFEGLSAQSVSLGQCDIRVSGATAQAECSGNARWTPKVGGGAQTAQRQWRFDLRNAGGNWLITQATTR